MTFYTKKYHSMDNPCDVLAEGLVKVDIDDL